MNIFSPSELNDIDSEDENTNNELETDEGKTNVKYFFWKCTVLYGIFDGVCTVRVRYLLKPPWPPWRRLSGTAIAW